MPTFATMALVCSMASGGAGVECDIINHGHFQAMNRAVCITKLEPLRFKYGVELLKRTGADKLLPGSHNCFETVEHRNTDQGRVLKKFVAAGIVFNVIQLD